MSIPEHIFHVYETATCLYNKQQVEEALDNMAQAIHNELENSNPLFLCVMVGGLIPAGNLLSRIDFPLELDYVHTSRYKRKTQGGILEWKNKPSTPMQDRTVLVLDDILDGGVTMQEIVNYCYQQSAKKVYTAVLLDKVKGRLPRGLAQADFTGLVVDDGFIFGYGMDYKDYLRNAPGIYAIAEEYLG